MLTIFADPVAHGVETISAETLYGDVAVGASYALLTLRFKGVRVPGVPAEGSFQIFGPREVLDKFTELTSRINEIFAEKKAEVEE